MWVNKSPEEIQPSAKPGKLAKWPVIFILSLTYLAIMIFNCGRLTQRPGPFIRSYDEIMRSLPCIIFLWLVTLIVVQFIKIPALQRKVVMICPKCEEAKDDDGVLTCSCGGHFVDIRTMKWVEPTA